VFLDCSATSHGRTAFLFWLHSLDDQLLDPVQVDADVPCSSVGDLDDPFSLKRVERLLLPLGTQAKTTAQERGSRMTQPAADLPLPTLTRWATITACRRLITDKKFLGTRNQLPARMRLAR
jgi:hypothetical protein